LKSYLKNKFFIKLNMSHDMTGPSMIKEMQEYCKQHPDQYRQFMKMQQNIQVTNEEKIKSQMSSREKLELAKEKLKGKRMSNLQKSIIEKKKETIAIENAEKEKKKDSEQKEKEERLRLKKQRKYAKKKLKKENYKVEKEFEIVE